MINILCIAKTRDGNISSAYDEFIKRIKKYRNIQLIELEDIKNFPDEQKTKTLENEKLINYIDKNLKDNYLIALDENGKEYDSIEFSDFLKKKLDSEYKITFVIGGHMGLNEALTNKCSIKVALSKLTFNHKLVRLILCEQIYRALAIIHGHPYHR